MYVPSLQSASLAFEHGWAQQEEGRCWTRQVSHGSLALERSASAGSEEGPASEASVEVPEAAAPGSWPALPLGMCVQLPLLSGLPEPQAAGCQAEAAQVLLWAQMAAAAQGGQLSAPALARQAPRQPEAGQPEARRSQARKARVRTPEATEPPEAEGRATVVLQNLPLNYRRQMLVRMLDAEGFSGLYNFLYLPMDFKTRAGFGYAFVNLVDPSVVPRFWRTFDGYDKWIFPCSKSCRVGWSEPLQGLRALIRRFRDSPLMHESVPDEYRPVMFSGGSRVPFPLPTKELLPPKHEIAAKVSKESRRRRAA